MTEFDPYAAPDIKGDQSRLGLTNEPLFIANSSLVARKGTDLPDICIYSGNVGDNLYMNKKLTFAPSWVLIICVLNLLIGLIVYLIVRKTARLGYYISPEVRSARLKLMLINWCIFAGGIGSLVVAASLDRPEIAIACPVMILISLIVYFAKLRGIYPHWIDQTTIGVRGINMRIMDKLVEASRY